jgi:multidrug efflux pump subunit AcrA (membrane-fusion protein)
LAGRRFRRPNDAYAKKTVLLTGFGVCAGAVFVSWAPLHGNSGVQYRTATVGHGDINVTISATGNPNAVLTVQVGARVSGIVMALCADFNTVVYGSNNWTTTVHLDPIETLLYE